MKSSSEYLKIALCLAFLQLVFSEELPLEPQALKDPPVGEPQALTGAIPTGAILLSQYDEVANVGNSKLLNNGGAKPGSGCEKAAISQCTELMEVLRNKELAFAATQEELKKMCPVLFNGLQCIDNYTVRCMNPKLRSYFNYLLSGTIRVIKDLCNTKGQYQKEYIRHAACMQKVHPMYNKCAEVYHSKTAKLNEVNSAVETLNEIDRRRNLITLCCSFQEYLQCSERTVYEACGNSTASFTKEFLDRMAGPLVQTKCSRYEPGSATCKYFSSSASSYSLSLLFIAFFAMFSYYSTLFQFSLFV